MSDSSSPIDPDSDAERPDLAANPREADAVDDASEAENDPGFQAVLLRYRHDGWLPDKQVEFIEMLADCGCVQEAARAVGMSANSAYALRRRPDAQAFRLAWDAALDHAVTRLGDAAMARAINGVEVPIYHGGELIGHRRHYDERLTMFLLRYRDPTRYGRWLDRMDTHQHQDGPARILGWRILRLMRAASAAFEAALHGRPQPLPAHEPVVGADGEFR